MSDKKKPAKKIPAKAKTKAKGRRTNGHALQEHVSEAVSAGLGVETPIRLPRSEPKNVQQTFRTTMTEHNQLINDASAAGFSSMSTYFRAMLKLPMEGYVLDEKGNPVATAQLVPSDD